MKDESEQRFLSLFHTVNCSRVPSPNAWAAGPAQAQAQENCGSVSRGAVRAERCAKKNIREALCNQADCKHPQNTLKPSVHHPSASHYETKRMATIREAQVEERNGK